MAATKTPQPLDYSFTSPIEKDGAFATFLTVPGSAELLGTRRAVKVVGTLDGEHPFEATLMPSGDGSHWLPLRLRCARRSVRARQAKKCRSTCISV